MPRIKIGAYVEDFVNWSYQELGAILDAISDAVTMFVSGVEWLLLAPPTIVMAAILAAVALLVRRKGVAVFTLLAFLLVDSFGLWVATMETLAVVLVSTRWRHLRWCWSRP
jgi:glycine betaine/proline transport system permease protein